jgi:hypothetical protein
MSFASSGSFARWTDGSIGWLRKEAGPAGAPFAFRDFLIELLTDQVERARPCETDGCGCGNRAYLFLGPEGAHPRRSNFSRRYWRPACDGIPEADRQKPRTGRRGPRPKHKPDWEAIAPGLTPHDLRHSHKTWMIEDGGPEVAQAERLGHQIPGVRGIYSHVSDAMREQIVTALQARWEARWGARRGWSARWVDTLSPTIPCQSPAPAGRSLTGSCPT